MIGYARLALVLAFFGTGGCGAASSDVEEEDPTTEASSELSQYKATVTTVPAPVIVGSPASLSIAVHAPGGAPITAFDPMHTKPMHLIAVSSDLEDFIHVHPVPQPAGDLLVGATFSLSEPYALFMEYDPAGAPAATLSRARVAPAGSHLVKAHLDPAEAFGGSVSKTVLAGATRVELVGTPGAMIMPNVPAHLVFRFHTASGGAVNDLTNWLGMPAHGIIVSPDLKTFRHVHGMAESAGGHGHVHDDGAMAATKTGPIGIDVTLPSAGLYKMFVQFQRGTTVITAPFVLSVMAGHGPPPPPPSCATMTCPARQQCMVMGAPPAPMCM